MPESSGIQTRSGRSSNFVAAYEELENVKAEIKREAERQLERYSPKGHALYQGVVDGGALVGEYGKWSTRLDRTRALFDRDQRLGAGLDLAADAADTLIGRHFPWVLSHPYFRYHEMHFKALKDVLVAMDKLEQTRTLADSIRSSTGKLRAELDRTKLELGSVSDGPTITRLRSRWNELLIGKYIFHNARRSLNPSDYQRFLWRDIRGVVRVYFGERSFRAELSGVADKLFGLVILANQELQAQQALLAAWERRIETHMTNGPGVGRKLEVIGGSVQSSIETIRDHEDDSGLRSIVTSTESKIRAFEKFAAAWADEMDRMERELSAYDDKA